MGAAQQHDGDEITGINVTPLVDVMMVLLIVFMVTANFMNQSAVKIELPKAASGLDPGPTNLSFVIDSDSNIYLDGHLFEVADLPASLDEKRAAGRGLQAVISADARTPHGAVIKVLDALRLNGVTDVAINVESK